MRKVVDSNYLGAPELTGYLGASRSNRIVLTEFVLHEQYKQHAAINVRASFSLCGAFPQQVIVLKRSPSILRMGFRQNLARDMVDEPQTRAFPEMCSLLFDLSQKAALDQQLGLRESASAEHTRGLLADAKLVPAVFSQITSEFSTDELAEIRDGVPMSRSTQDKLLGVAFAQMRKLYEAAQIEQRYWPRHVRDRINAFPFRYALCLILLFRRWVVHGKQKNRAPEKIVNDIVDANTAAFGTYFGGVLSHDRMLVSVHDEARHIIRMMRGYVAG